MLILILSFCASSEVIRASERVNVAQLIDSLENGFTFRWHMKNRFMRMDAEGIYMGKGRVDIKGSLKSPEGTMDVSGYNPYEQIRIVCGENRFVFKRKRRNTLIYEFPAVLFFLDPVKGMGKGLVYIKDGRIFKITAENENAKWCMDIGKYRKPVTRIRVDCDGCDMERIKLRLELWGERDVKLKENIFEFIEEVPLNSNLFKMGTVKWYVLESTRHGELKDPLDTLYTYSIDSPYNPEIIQINHGTDPRGRPSLIIGIKNPGNGIIGLFVDDSLVSTCYGNNPMIIPFRDSTVAKLVYIYLKTGRIGSCSIQIRRLK